MKTKYKIILLIQNSYILACKDLDSLLKNNNIIYSIILNPKSPKESYFIFLKKYFIIYGFFGSLKLLVKIFIEIFLKKKNLKNQISKISTILEIKNLNTNKFLKIIKNNEIDLLISIGCPQILSKKILSNLKLGAINVHGGYLPNYRGAYSVFWNLYDKSKYYGFSIHWMNEKIDKGSVIFRKKYKLNNKNTMFETYEKLAPNMIKYLDKIISNNLNLKKKIKISKWHKYRGFPNIYEKRKFLKDGNKII